MGLVFVAVLFTATGDDEAAAVGVAAALLAVVGEAGALSGSSDAVQPDSASNPARSGRKRSGLDMMPLQTTLQAV